MPRFQSKPVKPVVIEAIKLEQDMAFAQGSDPSVPMSKQQAKAGDWLVHFANGNLSVYTEAELQEEFLPVRGAANGMSTGDRPVRRKRRSKTNADGTPRRGPGRPRKATPPPTPSPTSPSPSQAA